MPRVLSLVILLIATFCSAAPVLAQMPPGAPSAAESLERARALAQEGLRYYNLLDFRTALAKFRESYLIEGRASRLFDIAQCYRMLGEHQSAIRSYRAYLAAHPGAFNRAEVERYIAEIEKAAHPAEPVSPVGAISTSPARPTNSENPPGEAPLPMVKSERAPVETPLLPVSPAADIAAAPMVMKEAPIRIWSQDRLGWGLVAIGVAGAVGGGGLVAGSSGLDGLDSKDPSDRSRSLGYQYGMQIGGYSAIGAGAILLIGGIVRFAMAARRSGGAH